jgi:hypothetical protein
MSTRGREKNTARLPPHADDRGSAPADRIAAVIFLRATARRRNHLAAWVCALLSCDNRTLSFFLCEKTRFLRRAKETASSRTGRIDDRFADGPSNGRL